jgi:AcrR family transcriptional regulator
MGRQKTISDDAVLRVAREVFRAKGHTATTREIAEAAGISEAVLYQRFGSKDHFFFVAMHPTVPDIEQLLGPEEVPDDPIDYLRAVTVRLGRYFAGVIPLALHVMTHPSYDPDMIRRGQGQGPATLRRGLERRLAALERRRQIATGTAASGARLLVSLAHDWALSNALAGKIAARHIDELEELVRLVWTGLRPRGKQ